MKIIKEIFTFPTVFLIAIICFVYFMATNPNLETILDKIGDVINKITIKLEENEIIGKIFVILFSCLLWASLYLVLQ
tara:strand:- start:872 stop:1102 length:231 start_codon:yes stop_codon:yes gene_type:complete